MSKKSVITNFEEISRKLERDMPAITNAAEHLASATSRQLFPYVNIADQVAKSMNWQLYPYVNIADQLTKSMSRQLFPYVNILGKEIDRLFDRFDFTCEARKRGYLLEENGWFPHYTMPEEFFDQAKGEEEFNARLLTFYRENWEEIRKTMAQNVSSYPIDKECKASFLEALEIHAAGFYRFVCPTMMSLTERIVRVEIYQKAVGRFQVGRLIQDRFATAPLSVFPDRSFWFLGFEQLTGHLYESINDADTHLQFLESPIPNRHASLHGLIAYRSEQNSLNSIFVADYVMQLITAWKLSERDLALGI